MHSIESRFVTGPLNMLFADVSVSTFQPRNFTGWGREGVNLALSTYMPLPFKTDRCSV